MVLSLLFGGKKGALLTACCTTTVRSGAIRPRRDGRFSATLGAEGGIYRLDADSIKHVETTQGEGYSPECVEVGFCELRLWAFCELRVDRFLGRSLLVKLLIPSLSPYVFYLRAVGRAYLPTTDVASASLYEGNKEATRGCTERKTQTVLSKRKPAGSSREHIGTLGGKLLAVATGLERGTYWSGSSRRSSLATNV